MDVSLVKTFSLIVGLLFFGSPQRVVSDWSLGLTVGFGGSSEPSLSLSFNYDPVFVYEKTLPNDLCGLSVVNLVFISPESTRLGCSHTLEHEMAHVWQYREYGLLSPILYLAFREYWEPQDGYTRVPYRRKSLNFPLVRIVIPLPPDPTGLPPVP